MKFSSKNIILILVVGLIVSVSLTIFFFLRIQKEEALLKDYIERMKEEGVISVEGKAPSSGFSQLPPLTPELERAVRRKVNEIAEKLVEKGWTENLRNEMAEISPLATWVNKEIFDKARFLCLEENINFNDPFLGFRQRLWNIEDLKQIVIRYNTCKALEKSDKEICNSLKELGSQNKALCQNSFLFFKEFLYPILTKSPEENVESEIETCDSILIFSKNYSRKDCLSFTEAIRGSDPSDCENISSGIMKNICLSITKNDLNYCTSSENGQAIDLERSCKDISLLSEALLNNNKENLNKLSVSVYPYTNFVRKNYFQEEVSCKQFAVEDYKNYCYTTFPPVE